MEDHTVSSAEFISDDCVKCSFSDGTVFYLRLSYLERAGVEETGAGCVLSEEFFEDFVQAGCAFAAEKAAVSYLSSREHSRYQLKLKLLKKNHSDEACEKALDFIEAKNWLSDSRFAEVWLRSRGISHFEGSSRLLQELMARGVSRNIAAEAVQNYFLEHPEEEQFQKAYAKLLKQGKTDEKLFVALKRLGFSNKIISDNKNIADR